MRRSLLHAYMQLHQLGGMCTEVVYALIALLHTVQGLAYVCGSCRAYHMRAVVDAAATAHNISNSTEQEETAEGLLALPVPEVHMLGGLSDSTTAENNLSSSLLGT